MTRKLNIDKAYNDTVETRPAGNRRLAKKRVQWLIEHSNSYQILCWVDSLVLRNPLLRQAPNRWASYILNYCILTTIYFKQQDNRQKEIAFFKYLQRNISQVQHINENYAISPLLLKNHIDIPRTIKSLKDYTKLSVSKRAKTIEALQTLPSKVFVAKSIKDVSVDFTIVKSNDIHFIEFHEKQHSQLSVSRPTPIFCSKGERFEIPRFAQRLLKDLWRWQNLPNYKIVWWDWFEKNGYSLDISNLTSKNRNEFYNTGRFCFSDFCQ